MLNLLMPCARVGDDDDTNPWDEWVGTWVRMSSWMHTNSFWLAAWHAIFAQLAKHDVRGRIDWSKHRAHMHTTSLWFMDDIEGDGAKVDDGGHVTRDRPGARRGRWWRGTPTAHRRTPG